MCTVGHKSCWFKFLSIPQCFAHDRYWCGRAWWGIFQDICTHFHKVWNIKLLFLPPQKNEPSTPMICGVRIKLYSNSRALINSPLMENCVCHVCIKIEKGWKASWVSLTAAKLQEAPFRFLVPASSLSSQFSGRRARGLTSECFLGEERKNGSLAESRDGMFGGDGVFMLGNLVMRNHYFVFLICSFLNQR